MSIKEFCKYMKMVFVSKTDTGFIAYIKSDVVAGMEVRNGKIINAKMRKIGTKKSYYNMSVVGSDISFGSKIHNYEAIKD